MNNKFYIWFRSQFYQKNNLNCLKLKIINKMNIFQKNQKMKKKVINQKTIYKETYKQIKLNSKIVKN